MNTNLVVLQGDITQLKVDAIVRRDSIWANGRTGKEAAGDAGHYLSKAYRSALQAAAASKARTIAFPDPDEHLSGFPRNTAAQIALTEVREFVKQHPGAFSEIIFACWDPDNYQLYKDMLGGENRVIHLP